MKTSPRERVDAGLAAAALYKARTNAAPITEAEAAATSGNGHDTSERAVVLENQGRQALESVTLDLRELASPEPPPFVIPEWLPEGCVTLLTAHGAGGKSQLALYIAICLAAGRALFDQPAGRPRRVAVYSCEDSDHVLRWRISNYCKALDIEPAALAGMLHIINAGDLQAPELFVAGTGRDSTGEPAPSYGTLRGYMHAERIEVLIVDNASDTFAASEIARPVVRAFFRALQRLLPDKAGAVLLLGHVNRSASAGGIAGQDGQNYSGSTAWHNSARSRWELTRDRKGGGGSGSGADDDDEAGTDAPYILKRVKGNYAAEQRAGVSFHWNHVHRVILPVEQAGPLVQAIEQRNIEHQVLAAFAEAHETGQRISPAVTANNNAAAIFTSMGVGLPRRLRSMKALAPVLRRLQQRGFLTIEQYTDDGQRKTRQQWTLTENGFAEVRK
ncbi:AAA family ATPase [Variovorax sp. Sphag1AA]|uniref:AAA family ATPase n=1 Tax=Variovorax sp. Sphag1AA TaxID=2587027 RepID=UPI00160833A1|nr:AAA family ATPase [Variovorax sp. Sphag1AA]MBB3175897.1 RecA-family ATPase [Variovorax sp. Sphag1AA]